MQFFGGFRSTLPVGLQQLTGKRLVSVTGSENADSRICGAQRQIQGNVLSLSSPCLPVLSSSVLLALATLPRLSELACMSSPLSRSFRLAPLSRACLGLVSVVLLLSVFSSFSVVFLFRLSPLSDLLSSLSALTRMSRSSRWSSLFALSRLPRLP